MPAYSGVRRSLASRESPIFRRRSCGSGRFELLASESHANQFRSRADATRPDEARATRLRPGVIFAYETGVSLATEASPRLAANQFGSGYSTRVRADTNPTESRPTSPLRMSTNLAILSSYGRSSSPRSP